MWACALVSHIKVFWSLLFNHKSQSSHLPASTVDFSLGVFLKSFLTYTSGGLFQRCPSSGHESTGHCSTSTGHLPIFLQFCNPKSPKHPSRWLEGCTPAVGTRAAQVASNQGWGRHPLPLPFHVVGCPPEPEYIFELVLQNLICSLRLPSSCQMP